jgi:hypothetical protein
MPVYEVKIGGRTVEVEAGSPADLDRKIPEVAAALGGGGSGGFRPVTPTVGAAMGAPPAPHLGALREPDQRAGERFAGPLGFQRPLSYEPVRQTIIGTGGMLGGLAGLPSGPQGAIGGSMLGTALGAGAAEIPAAIGRATPARHFIDFGKPRTAGSMAYEMGYEAIWDLAGYGAGRALATAGRPLKTIAKRTLTADDLARGERARALGINVGYQDASQGFLARHTQPLVGQLPGFVGPFRAAFRSKADDQARTILSFLDTAGPRSANEAELSRRVVTEARGRMQHVYTVLDAAYNGLYNRMEQAGVFVDPTRAKQTAEAYLANVRAEGVPKQTAEGVVKKIRSTPGTRLAQTILAMPNTISVKEYRGLLTEIDTAIRQAGKSGYDVGKLVEMKQSLVEQMGESLVGNSATPFRTQYQSLREVWKQAEELASGPLASRVPGRMAFANSEGRNIAEDLFFDASLRDFSPDSMRELRRLVGHDAYRAVVARRLETAVEAARVASKESGVSTFEAAKFRQSFGLEDAKGITFHAWKSALEPLGVSMGDLRRLADALETANRVGEPRSQGLAKRRVALAGARSIGTSLLPTAAAAAVGGPQAGMPTMLATYLGIRRWGKIVTDPNILRELTREIQEETAVAAGTATRAAVDKARASAMRRLLVAKALNAVADASVSTDSEAGSREGVPPVQITPGPMQVPALGGLR